MSMRTYGYCLAAIMSSIPIILGVWGIYAGISQVRFGPAIIGIILLLVSWTIGKTIVNAANSNVHDVRTPKPVNWRLEPKLKSEILF